MTTSTKPDNFADRLALIIQNTKGELRERFIAIRDAESYEAKQAMYGALRSDAMADKALADACRWIETLRPFLAPGVSILPPSSPKP